MKLFKIKSLQTSEERFYIKKENMCEDYDLTPSLVSRTMKGLRNHHKGYVFERLDVDDYTQYKIEDFDRNFPKTTFEKETVNGIINPPLFNKNIKMAILEGDVHFKYEDKHAVDILYQVCEDYKDYIDEFIDGGDGVNNNALSKFVSTEEEEYNLYEEVLAFEEHLWNIKDIIPNAKFVMIEDNHYHLRKKKFLAENPQMKGFLKDINFPFDKVVKHGTPYKPFAQNRVGIIHGLKTTDNFTKAHCQLFKEDIINFHTHTSQHYTAKNGSKILNKYPQKMWGMPSMCKQMDYLNGSPSRMNTGFGVLWYDVENDLYSLTYIFVESNKAIFNGKTYISRIKE